MNVRLPLPMAIIVLAAFASGLAAMQVSASKPDDLARINFLVGDWRGISAGEPGNGAVERKYEPVLNGRFIRVTNRSVYPSQEKNKTGVWVELG